MWIAIAGLSVAGVLLLSIMCASGEHPATGTATPAVRDTTVQVLDHAGDLLTTDVDNDDGAPSVAVDRPAPLPPGVRETDLVIGRRETFYDAMRRIGAGHSDIMALVNVCKPYRDLGKVRGGLEFQVAVNDAGRVHGLRFDLADDESYLTFDRDADDAFQVRMLTYPVDHRTCVVSGEVEDSLYESLKAAGAPSALAAKMNDILGWDVDFRRDVRRGDRFRILYEEVWRDGRFVRTGPVLAMEYVNQGHLHRGFRYVDDDDQPGYFDEEGRNLEKQLLRAPLEYSRISSSFSNNRYHPVHKRWMPHYGVDYAAPVGTPVRAGGAGTVLDARYDKHNGRFVHIRHTNRSYESYYLHFSRFAKGIRKGVKVRQGQVIGYVGATGVASGPHLDYRVKVDGRWQNPRTLKLPPAEPLRGDDLTAFRSQIALSCYSLAAAPAVCASWPVAHDQPLCPPYLPGGPLAPNHTRLAAVSATAVAAP